MVKKNAENFRVSKQTQSCWVCLLTKHILRTLPLARTDCPWQSGFLQIQPVKLHCLCSNFASLVNLKNQLLQWRSSVHNELNWVRTEFCSSPLTFTVIEWGKWDQSPAEPNVNRKSSGVSIETWVRARKKQSRLHWSVCSISTKGLLLWTAKVVNGKQGPQTWGFHPALLNS